MDVRPGGAGPSKTHMPRKFDPQMTTLTEASASRRPAFEKVALVLFALLLTAALAIGFTARDVFNDAFAVEDGPVENATALFLFLAGLALASRVRSADMTLAGKVLTLLYAALFVFAAGEEISWGQRIFGLQSSEFFLQNNDQSEITLHNLVIGGVKLDESLFGPMLSLVILTYLLVLPLLWPRVALVRRLCERLAVPVPRSRHAILTLVATLLVPLIPASRKWEVYECAFSLIALSIFLVPSEPEEAAQPA